MVRQNKTPGEILKKGFVDLFWKLVAAVLSVLVIWFIGMPLLKKQFRKLGRDVSAPSAQFTNDNKAAK